MGEKHSSQKSNSIRSWWSNLSGRAKAVWTVAVGLSSFCAAAFAVYNYFVPHIGISPGVVGSDIDATKAEFVVANGGHFNVRNAVIRCEIHPSRGKFISEGNVIIGSDRPPMFQGISELAPGKIATRNCGGGITMVPFPATFDVNVIFDWPFYWDRITATEHFASIRAGDGHIFIQLDSQ